MAVLRVLNFTRNLADGESLTNSAQLFCIPATGMLLKHGSTCIPSLNQFYANVLAW